MSLFIAIKNKINKRSGYLTALCTGLFAFSLLTVFSAPTIVYADHCGDGLPASHPTHRANCGGEELDCSPERNDYRETTSDKCDLYKKYLNPIIWFLSALVGLAVVIGIISGAIRYSASGGDPSQAAAAKKLIRNAIVALLAYLFLMAGLNWLVPGGLT